MDTQAPQDNGGNPHRPEQPAPQANSRDGERVNMSQIKFSTVKKILAASSGNFVEWFDFYIYAFFSVYFADQFFQDAGKTGALLGTAAVFFVGFLMRPIGGYLFGRLADTYGRKRSMVVAITMMCIGSLLFAVLPTAATIGVFAPIAMTAVRCLQGLSVGGEYGSTATYMSEVAESGRRGFYSSFQYVTLIGGQLAASALAVVMTHTLGDDAITAGWWRLPFVLGAVAALVSFWLRRGLDETVSEKEMNAEGAGTLREMLRNQRSFWVVLGITSLGSLTFYTATTYMQKYLITSHDFSKGDVADAMTVCLLLFMFMQPVAGWITDKIGRKNAMIIYGLAMTFGVIPYFALLQRQSSLAACAVIIIVAMAFLSLYTSCSGVLKAEMFPAHVRAMGVGFTYAIGNSLFGGSAEYVALWFKHNDRAQLFPVYITVIAIVALVAIYFLKDNRVHSTIDNDDREKARR